MDEPQASDICRVCRCEATSDKPLFHPCICTGSIKWIHQDCLTLWMRYSRKEYCELCRYQFTFMPIYDENMPRHLPIRDVIAGLLNIVVTALKYWLHYTIVAGAWLGVVPIVACRIFSCLFQLSIDSMLTLPYDLFSVKNLAADMFQGSFIVTCTLFAFIGLVWLREQIMHGGGPEWLEPDDAVDHDQAANRQQDQPAGEGFDEAENENAPLAQVDENRQDVAAVDEHNNWNPVEWDRAEELTWERLLGLDGSLIFLEHVFWVVSLNTLFIVLFAFLPYNIGNIFLSVMELKEYASASRFEGLVTTLFGYVLSSLLLVAAHTIVSITRLAKLSRMLGLCYIVVKVSLLLVIEIGALPLVCGWWLDICSLPVFNATIRDRESSFTLAPGTSMFLHWLIGMVFVYYFASFVLMLREVLRPGVLWFLRNLNDPDFSPIQEMIHLPMYKHVQRLMASCIIFGMVVMLILYVPSRILKAIWPSFLPYVMTSHTESVNELSFELLLLQVVMPALLEQHYIRQWVRATIRLWCLTVAWCLDLKSYLLGDAVHFRDEAAPQPPPAAAGGAPNAEPVEAVAGLGAAHHALLQRGHPTVFQPYMKPRWFAVRIAILLTVICLTTVAASLVVLTLPVYVGRKVVSVGPSLLLSKPVPTVHELYTASTGMYVLWLIARIVATMVSWLPKGKMVVLKRVWKISQSTMKAMFAVFWLMGVIPFLFGLLVELVIVVPLRVPLDQTPVIWTWLDWGLGLLYMKISCALLMMGPDCHMKRALERMFRNGIQRMNLKFVIKEVVIPVVSVLALLLALPYTISHGIVPMMVKSFRMQNLIARRIYPFLLLVTLLGFGASFGGRQSIRWYEHIRNDKYLVGRKLVNYNHKVRNEISTTDVTTAETPAADS